LVKHVQPAIVLGTGMAGLGAAQALALAGMPAVCYEKNAYFGGHTTTFAHPNGFLFDDGPHLSFTKNERIQALLADNVGQSYEDIQARINNYWQGYWIPHPAQCNLYGLPADLQVKVIRDFVETRQNDGKPISHYADWLEAAYGRTFAQTFPMVYGLKYHTTSAENMTTDWLGPRMYRPSLEEVLHGALAPAANTAMHYVTSFRYPSSGGFAAYLRPFAERTDLRLCHELIGLDPKCRRLRFANGAVVPYERLISSIPLPDLVPCIDGAPTDVLAAVRRLAFTTAVIVNLGVDRVDLSEAHISYFYDPDIIFPRVNFPHMLSPHNTPSGTGSIQVEVYFSDKYRPLDRPPEALIEPVIHDLHKVGILREDDTLLLQEARLVRYANVIYDHGRTEALATVHAFLDEIGIHYCGRYGDWNHSWTDEAFVSGEQAARTALGEQPVTAARDNAIT
jgi:protoporphyrinogen oxidase